MNYEEMSFDELKDVAKEYNIKVGNIGKDKLIEKIKSAQTLKDINSDDDFVEEKSNSLNNTVVVSKSVGNTLDSVISVVEELDENGGKDDENEFVDLPMDTVIPVKSITFGTLIYKSSQNNAKFIWNNIGVVQNMTIAQINEMNNSSTDYLYKPYVILADERAIKYFRLTSVYENVAKINNLKDLFKRPLAEISQTIDNILELNMRDVLMSKVRTMYDKKILTDIRVIRLLGEKLKFDFAE